MLQDGCSERRGHGVYVDYVDPEARRFDYPHRFEQVAAGDCDVYVGIKPEAAAACGRAEMDDAAHSIQRRQLACKSTRLGSGIVETGRPGQRLPCIVPPGAGDYAFKEFFSCGFVAGLRFHLS